jgi:UPF0176 protein
MNVATFYRFVRIDDPAAVAATLRAWCDEFDLRGTILLAREGINATLTGTDDELTGFVARLQCDARFAAMPVRRSCGDDENPVFFRMKVRVRRELIAMRRDDVDPAARTGVHVDAAQWNRLLDDPDVTVIDARNHYEIALGTFPGALDPGTRSFREFPDFAASLDPQRQRKIAMFCTGGIRCEKASAYLLERGFEKVYQLDGGILNYLEDAGTDNRFVGECFVFDQRVSVADDLAQGGYASCHACRAALTQADTQSPDYVVDVSCPHCIGAQTERQRVAFAERARQARLAAARGERHVGAVMASEQRRQR